MLNYTGEREHTALWKTILLILPSASLAVVATVVEHVPGEVSKLNIRYYFVDLDKQ